MKNLLSFVICLMFTGIAQAQFSDVKVGDVLDISGTKGFVFMVDADGKHGSMISLDIFRKYVEGYCTQRSYLNDLVMDSKIDGMKNTQEVYDYINKKGHKPKTFPAFEWCKKLGEGWYIPSVGQLEIFINYWLDNNKLLDWDTVEDDEYQVNDSTISHSKMVNKLLIEAGGYPFLSGLYTSTKSDGGNVYAYYFDRDNNCWKFRKRPLISFGVFAHGRAFYDF